MPVREYIRSFRGTRFVSTRQPHGALTVAVTRLSESRTDGPVFVLVHGIGISSRMFLPVSLRLTEHGRVHLVDLPGYGFAPDPRQHVSLHDHVEVLATYIRSSGLEPVVVVGHSMGAQVVTALGEKRPELVSRVVLIAPTLEPSRRTVARAVGGLLRDAFKEPLIVSWIAFTDYVFRCGLPYLIRQFPVLLGDALEERIARVPQDMLIVRGSDDVLVSHEWCTELARESGARLVEVPGPHSVMYSDPDRIVDEIVRLAPDPGASPGTGDAANGDADADAGAR